MDQYRYLNISSNPDTSPLDIFVAGTDEVYTIRPISNGWRFSRVTRRGTVSVAIADGRILSGSRILDALRIAAACPGGGEELYRALSSAEIPDSPFRALPWMLPDPASQSSAHGIAIRSFLSGKDIERFLSFPFQKVTEVYQYTILAPATASLRPAAETDESIARISTPIERRYSVVYPDGVRPSSRAASYGDELSLTYYAEGKKDATHHFTVGKPSPFVEYDGATIRVRPISALGISLDPIEEPKREPATPAPEVKKPSAAAQEAKSGSRTITLVMRFSEDRVVRSELTLSDDSAEYRLLRAGMFHGRRARRLAVRHHGDESYLIDLREEKSAEGPQKEDVGPSAPTADEPQRRPHRRRTAGPWLYIILGIVAIGLGIVAVSYLPGLFEHVSSYDDDMLAAENAITTPAALAANLPDTSAAAPDTIPAILTPEPSEADEAADPTTDYAYLNRNTVWQRDSLTTEGGLAVFDIISTGDLGAIPAQEFFASGACENPAVMKVIRMIWQAKGSQTQTGNERALRALGGQASIDFDALFLELAGIRPANPNNRPMPSTN